MANRNVKYCDLHTHTTASDGQYTPTQLVYLAAEAYAAGLWKKLCQTD